MSKEYQDHGCKEYKIAQIKAEIVSEGLAPLGTTYDDKVTLDSLYFWNSKTKSGYCDPDCPLSWSETLAGMNERQISTTGITRAIGEVNRAFNKRGNLKVTLGETRSFEDYKQLAQIMGIYERFALHYFQIFVKKR